MIHDLPISLHGDVKDKNIYPMLLSHHHPQEQMKMSSLVTQYFEECWNNLYLVIHYTQL